MSSTIEKGKAPAAAGESPAVAAVNHHADPTTEQVFATFSLTTDSSSPTTSTAKTFRGGGVTYVVKILSKSETKHRNKSFLMLPARAHHVFRDSGDELDVYDLKNRRWRFGHVESGSPPVHLLTNGWGHFLSSKKLVAGDAVVFVRDADGTVFVGCRRFGCDECDNIALRMEPSSSLMPKTVWKKREEAEMVIQALRWAVEDGEIADGFFSFWEKLMASHAGFMIL